MFAGPRGTGKTTVARLLAKTVNCISAKDAEPCNSCPNCIQVMEGNFMDVIEIDAASNRGIDEIRSLRESVRYMPAEGKYRVYIIDEVHMLTPEAFNALLKTLEEPPEHVIFILATTAPHKIPVTITSRCQRLDFRRLSIEDIEGYLKKILEAQSVNWEPGAIRVLARAAQGSMRDALSVLDLCLTYGHGQLLEKDVRDVLGETSSETMLRLFNEFSKKNCTGVLNITREIAEAGKDMGEFTQEIGLYARDLLLVRAGGSGTEIGRSEEEAKEMIALVDQIRPKDIIHILDATSKVMGAMKFCDDPRLVLETYLLGLFTASTEEIERIQFEPARPAGEHIPQTKKEPKKGPVPALEETMAAGNDVFELVVAKWQTVLDALQEGKKIMARAYLLPSKPSKIENGTTLVLTYDPGYSTHMEQIMSRPNKQIVEQCIKNVIGISLRIKAQSGNGNGNTGNESVSGNGDVHPLVQAAIEMINGRIEN